MDLPTDPNEGEKGSTLNGSGVMDWHSAVARGALNVAPGESLGSTSSTSVRS